MYNHAHLITPAPPYASRTTFLNQMHTGHRKQSHKKSTHTQLSLHQNTLSVCTKIPPHPPTWRLTSLPTWVEQHHLFTNLHPSHHRHPSSQPGGHTISSHQWCCTIIAAVGEMLLLSTGAIGGWGIHDLSWDWKYCVEEQRTATISISTIYTRSIYNPQATPISDVLSNLILILYSLQPRTRTPVSKSYWRY